MFFQIGAFTQRNFYAQNFNTQMPTRLHGGSFIHTHTQKRLYTRTLHTNTPTAFTHGSSYTEDFAQGSFCNRSFFTHKSFYSEKPVNRAALYTEAFTHTHTQKKH